MSLKLEGAKFASLLTPRPRFYSNSGSKMADDYEIIIDKKGHKSLKKCGEHDIYAEIQSYYEETKIENILARAAAGDVAALNQKSGFYADITDTPANLMEAQNMILKLEKAFYSLPTEIRANFDNSKEKFVSMYGSEDFIKAMGWNVEETEKTNEQTFTGEAIPETLTPGGKAE